MEVLLALFLGASLTAAFYKVFPLPFLEGGLVKELLENPIAEIILGLTFWALVLLFFKQKRLYKENQACRAFYHSELRAAYDIDIYTANAEEVMQSLESVFGRRKQKKRTQSVIFQRTQEILEYVKTGPKQESLGGFLASQSEIASKRMEQGYILLHVLVWAIPILGFIGTVMGISEAVRDFSLFIQTAQGGQDFGLEMRSALGGVTTGLSLAFNTTFLALLLVIPVMMLTSLQNKNEAHMLLFVEEFCLHKLLPRLKIVPSNQARGEDFDAHLHRIMQLSSKWLEQLEPLVGSLKENTELVVHQIEGVQPVVRNFTESMLQEASSPENSLEKTSVQKIPVQKTSSEEEQEEKTDPKSFPSSSNPS